MAVIDPDIAYEMDLCGSLHSKIAQRFRASVKEASAAVRAGKELRLCDGAYSLFWMGKNSNEIARIQNIDEPKALKRLTIGRCRAKGLPFPYAVKEA